MDSSKDQQQNKDGDKQFSVQPIKHDVDPKTAPFQATPGPVIAENMPAEEGTKEERQAKMETMNKG
ncbi:hypothetical protein HIM_04946 [Hirsutella minnesotensis 3608]|uniref:Uncharacterized protein n=1 Tax=Hirsutella minnesotensis 3608 TaxID=1043627 RepID=A0A0F8A5R5_9HYPO|nr:hypothetical protein HIM_04946 [Hirsutella minnesotensis 3608]